LFTQAEFDHHEQVLFGHEERTGLRGIIAVHSTALGPAAGANGDSRRSLAEPTGADDAEVGQRAYSYSEANR